MKDYKPAKKQIEVSVGESVRIVLELEEMSRGGLRALTPYDLNDQSKVTETHHLY